MRKMLADNLKVLQSHHLGIETSYASRLSALEIILQSHHLGIETIVS